MGFASAKASLQLTLNIEVKVHWLQAVLMVLRYYKEVRHEFQPAEIQISLDVLDDSGIGYFISVLRCRSTLSCLLTNIVIKRRIAALSIAWGSIIADSRSDRATLKCLQFHRPSVQSATLWPQSRETRMKVLTSDTLCVHSFSLINPIPYCQTSTRLI